MNRSMSTLPEDAERIDPELLVRSAPEVAGHLREMARHRVPVTLYYGGKGAFCVTTLLAADAAQAVLDVPQDSSVRRAITDSTSITCVAFVDSVKTQFSIDAAPRTVEWEGGPALRIPLPPALLRLQRRNHFRVRAPKSTPPVCEMPVDGGEPLRFDLSDLSVGGAAFVTTPEGTVLEAGTRVEGCRVSLPGHGEFSVTVELRNLTPLLGDDKPRLRLGCRFVDLPGTVESQIQRYINDLQRARRALQ
jgi:c-di-GMP-binding flagellar brake protein YcgR